jgi:hypothetical protein
MRRLISTRRIGAILRSMVSDATGTDLLGFILVLVVAVIAFGIAVWFGLRVVAPRLGRALDRAAAEDADTVDRDD